MDDGDARRDEDRIRHAEDMVKGENMDRQENIAWIAVMSVTLIGGGFFGAWICGLPWWCAGFMAIGIVAAAVTSNLAGRFLLWLMNAIISKIMDNG